jgi:DNA repair exonuclease SbcCD ATPase subunit
MSRWLKNVGNFLDQLDSTAAVAVTAAVNGRHPDDDEDDADNEGLLFHPMGSDNDGPRGTAAMYLRNQVLGETDDESELKQQHQDEDALTKELSERHAETENTLELPHNFDDEVTSSTLNEPKDGQDVVEPSVSNIDLNLTEIPDTLVDFAGGCDAAPTSGNGTTLPKPETPFQTPQQIPPQQENAGESERIRELEQELQYYQQRFVQLQQEKQQEAAVLSKEARTLRRHLATLNEQLSAADKEVGAQRVELENAATRLESDRLKYKQDLQAAAVKHAAEMQKQSRSHQEAIAAMQQQSQSHIETLKKELQDIHERRKQEGGDWRVELDDAMQREKMARHECALQQEENSALMAHISTLQSQQETVGSRLEALTAMADSAVIREREAELRLDDAMALHARQLSQRNAREAELERTVAELSAALVAEQSKRSCFVAGHVVATKQAPGDVTAQDDNAALELDAIKAQLEIERQQNASLRHELSESVRERQDELAVSQTRQKQHDRKVSELTQQLMELRASLRDTNQDFSGRRKSEEAAMDSQRIQELTEDLMRMRERLSSSNSETAALRNRLQAALNRAVVAEAAAESAFSNSDLSGQHDLERATVVRRRGNSKSSNSKEAPTIRAALHLDSFQASGDSSSGQGIGKGLDILDKFLSSSGEILRFNPFARLLFGMFYLIGFTFILRIQVVLTVLSISHLSPSPSYVDFCSSLFSRARF